MMTGRKMWIAVAAVVVTGGVLLVLHTNNARGSVNLDTADSHLRFVNSNLVIHTDDHGDAVISPTGDLTLDGKAADVNRPDRALLKDYYDTTDHLVTKAKGIGKDAAHLAISAIGEAFAALFSGDENNIDARVEEQAAPIKAQARLLCKDVDHLKILETRLSSDIPDFAPYAVVRNNSHCNVD